MTSCCSPPGRSRTGRSRRGARPVPASTVRSRLHRVRHRLQALLVPTEENTHEFKLDETLELLHRDARAAPDLSAARAKLMAELEPGATVHPLRPRRFALPVAAAVAGVVAVTAVVVQVSSSGPAETPKAAAPAPSSQCPPRRPADPADVGDGGAEPGCRPQRRRGRPAGRGRAVPLRRRAHLGRAWCPDRDGTGYTYLWEQRIERWIPADAHDMSGRRTVRS